ncbi:hypothetical protein ICG_04720 [Bacillus cereus BAG1X1-3]|nr:hypothetical protein ICG_04720 [Bacillus cereus BAG1X1-3]EOO80496.1 hypothetical protein IC7_00045 [Bacillus cereus BAG1O-1]
MYVFLHSFINIKIRFKLTENKAIEFIFTSEPIGINKEEKNTIVDIFYNQFDFKN